MFSLSCVYHCGFSGADQQVVDFLKQIQESSCPGIGGGGGDKEEGEGSQVGVRQLLCSSEGVTEQSCAATDVSTRDKVRAAATGVGSKEEEEAEEEEEEEVEDINARDSTGGVREKDRGVQESDAVLARRIVKQLENKSYYPPPAHLTSAVHQNC